MDTLFPYEAYQYIALNFGLVILAAWFYILLLILREFRRFAVSMTGKGQLSEEHESVIALCKESVQRASQFSEQNGRTISELAQVQLALEQQLTQIRSSTADHITKEEQDSINDLNKKLSRSHKLIRKLKGDLDKTSKQLSDVKTELDIRTSSFIELQTNNKKLHDEVTSLKLQREEWFNEPATPVSQDKAELNKIINDYKRQLHEQNQLIEQLSLQTSEEFDPAEIAELQKDLEQAKTKIKHLNKEKKFIEGRYLDAVKANKSV
ncbi:chromosome partitioning protein ParA [Pseudoalteromonas phenolica]|uniref:Chromosome partitioning protein ParA n=2 Tax=Pseudoalteromonas phenolica TaxID=161398 RepID=A0A4Q7IJN4_9GAMM|nr:chromosome partitioning protein ParA [Pseudoalteromonas phenolica]TMN90114.1 chromosome partitioning protein ParA [Pseudoalteromonas phenolica]TMP77839.1 chromosome partitioning protein ParA [Pseudoalteromonas phenolica]